jgi:hypothetical protein
VIDGVSESGPSDKVLAAFLNSPHTDTTPVLLGSRLDSRLAPLVWKFKEGEGKK